MSSTSPSDKRQLEILNGKGRAWSPALLVRLPAANVLPVHGKGSLCELVIVPDQPSVPFSLRR
jgi:hypothetical protein